MQRPALTDRPQTEDKEMRMRSLALLLTTTAPGASHVLPHATGKRRVAPYFRDGNWISAEKMQRWRHG
jgi:enoyl-CoA hydratase/carnithine racemase